MMNFKAFHTLNMCFFNAAGSLSLGRIQGTLGVILELILVETITHLGS